MSGPSGYGGGGGDAGDRREQSDRSRWGHTAAANAALKRRQEGSPEEDRPPSKISRGSTDDLTESFRRVQANLGDRASEDGRPLQRVRPSDDGPAAAQRGAVPQFGHDDGSRPRPAPHQPARREEDHGLPYWGQPPPAPSQPGSQNRRGPQAGPRGRQAAYIDLTGVEEPASESTSPVQLGPRRPTTATAGSRPQPAPKTQLLGVLKPPQYLKGEPLVPWTVGPPAPAPARQPVRDSAARADKQKGDKPQHLYIRPAQDLDKLPR